MSFNYEDALKKYNKDTSRGVIQTNSAVKTAYCWNVANSLGKPTPERNHYLYTNILMFLTINDLKERLKKELKEKYGEVMSTLSQCGYVHNQISHYENVLARIQSENQAHAFIRKVFKKQLPEICARALYVEPWLMRVHTFLVMNSDCKDLPVPKEWVLQARDYKTNFIHDPRLQGLVNRRMSDNMGGDSPPPAENFDN